MAKIEDIERRLLNWARWKLGAASGGLGYATVRYWDSVASSGYRDSVIPTSDCEAEETDRAILSLPSELRATVEMVYLVNRPARWKAERLCCTEVTVGARIWRAHRKIDEWLSQVRQQAQRERERTEAIQRKAHPRMGDDMRLNEQKSAVVSVYDSNRWSSPP